MKSNQASHPTAGLKWIYLIVVLKLVFHLFIPNWITVIDYVEHPSNSDNDYVDHHFNRDKQNRVWDGLL